MSIFKQFLCTAVCMAMCCVISTAQVDLPQKSPKASVSYTIGLTNISIDYSSPAVGERDIWGALVPFGEVWRAGANAATTIDFSTDVVVEGKSLAAGKYALFLIPRDGEEKWTVIFNKVSDQWGAYQYAENEDALRVDVTPKPSKVNEERLTFSIHDQTVEKGYIRMGWEKMRVYVRFKVDVLEPALVNVEKALESAEDKDKWAIYAQGASFLTDNDWEPRQAMEWADKSTQLFDHSWNWYIKAKAQAKSGDYSGAIESAAKSAEVGNANADDNFYANSKDEVEGMVAEWRQKTGS